MVSTDVRLTTTIHAPLELVFERLTDHERMSDWPGVSRCTLIQEGTPKNGVGAVREVKTSGLTLHERIVRFEPPTRYEYTIIKGLPVEHLGTVTLREENGAVELSWNVHLTSRIPLMGRIIRAVLRRGLRKALAYFKDQTELAARTEA